jgi:hypothetical protein
MSALPKSQLKWAFRFGTCRSYSPVGAPRAANIFGQFDSAVLSGCWQAALRPRAAQAFAKQPGLPAIATSATSIAFFDIALVAHPALVAGRIKHPDTKDRRGEKTAPRHTARSRLLP